MHNQSALSAFFISLLVCLVLMGLLAWVVVGQVISPTLMPVVFMGTVLFCIALITLLVYQTLRADHTIKVLANESYLNSQELFSELYYNSPVPYVVIDDEGHIESVNYATARLFSMEIQNFQGKDIFSALESDDEEKFSLIPEYYKRGKFVNDVEARIYRSDGMVRWVMLSLFSFTDPQKHRKGLMTLFDITKQKQVDKAKTEFVSLASHQLRTPVTAMRWNLELFATTSGERLDEQQQMYLKKITNGLERMDNLVGDFLNVSKLELGTLTVQKSEFDLTQFFTNVMDEYTAFAEKRGVTVSTNWNEPFGNIVTDNHLFNMVVSNVLGNAIKYTPEHGTVRAYATMSDSALTIQISDTGIGIPKEDQEMIFSKLFRASNAQNHEAGGTGLGLYIVKEAVRILGGTITFESEMGVGTTFTIVLPK